MGQYFREHLDFLIEGGRRLAEAFPRAAERLARKGLDPDVERLLEGIAHISGAIEEKHDASLPDVSQLIFDILFPHYLCPLPSTAIVQLEGNHLARLPRGSELDSPAVAGTPCRFRTIYDAELGALSLTDVQWQARGRLSRLLLQLKLRRDRPLPARLRLFLHGEPLLTRSLFGSLQTRLDQIEVVDGNGRLLARGGLKLQPLGFAEDEALFPYPEGSFDGFRLLQEYFALPQKFLFLDLVGLPEVLQGQPLTDELSIYFDLRVDASRSVTVGSHNVRLGCTPVVNVFEHSADPVQRHPGRLEYPVRPAGPHGHYAAYRVLSVTGYGRDGFMEYPVLSELDLATQRGAFCQLHRRDREGQMLIYFSLNDGDQPPPLRQALLCDLLCSNGVLPHGLRVGEWFTPVEPGLPSARLITPATRSVAVEVGETLPTRLATHMALSQRDLTSLEALRDLVTLYNFNAMGDVQAARGHRLLQQGLLEAESRLVQHSYRRIPIWGRSTVLTVEESAFENEGELHLFGSILNEVIALQAPINTFSEFAIRGARSQETQRWPRRLGRRLLEGS